MNHKLKTIISLWIIYSAVGMAITLIVFLLPADTILKASPTCYSVKQLGKQCFMCGSTRSFLKAAQGNFNNAIHLNRLAFVLFIIMICNTFIFALYLTNQLTKTKK
jgi:hypothetical protein